MDCLLKAAIDAVRTERWSETNGLNVWTDGADLIVANNIEEAQQVQRDVFGDDFDIRDPSWWSVVRGKQDLKIWPEPDRDGTPITRTVDDWIARSGTSPSLLATGDRGGVKGWELVEAKAMNTMPIVDPPIVAIEKEPRLTNTSTKRP